jgi:hypothetical protein
MSERDDEALEEAEDAESALPEDDLEHYDGEWVALRDGKVVAHDPDPDALQANPAVLPTDDAGNPLPIPDELDPTTDPELAATLSECAPEPGSA